MAKIKYNNFLYTVTAKDYFKIVALKGLLLFRRIRRWRCLIKKTDLLLLTLITLIWLFASIIFSALDYSALMKSVLSIKEEYVSSVIIVGFIGFYSRASAYHEKNVEQAWVYEKTQWAFNKIFDPFYGEMGYYYMPLYSDLAYDATIEMIDAMKSTIRQTDFELTAKGVLRRLDLLEQFSILHRFNQCDYQMMDLYIDDCQEIMHTVIDYRNNDLEVELKKFALNAFFLLEEIRKMWRMDLDLNHRIMKILVDNGCQLMEDFYKRMLYYEFDEIETYVDMQELDN